MAARTEMSAGMAIAIGELRQVVRVHAAETLEERLKRAMHAGRDDGPWFLEPGAIDDGQRLQAAVAAVILETIGAEQERVRRSMQFLLKGSHMLEAIVNSVPIDVEEAVRQLEAEFPDRDSLLDLRGLWSESQ